MPRRPERDEDVDAALGRVLRQLRLERGLFQERLGNESNSGRTFISELERAKRGASVKTLFRLAAYLDVMPSEIVRRIEDELASRSGRRRGRANSVHRPHSN